MEDSILSFSEILFCARYFSKVLFEDTFILHNEAAFYPDFAT